MLGGEELQVRARVLLYVEDSIDVATAVNRALRDEPVQLVLAGNLFEARARLEEARSGRLDIAGALLDVELPDGSGLELIAELEALDPAPRIAVLSGHLDPSKMVDLIGRCEVALPKPLPSDKLRNLARYLVASSKLASMVTAYAHKHGLSEQETRLLKSAATGASKDECAAQLGCRPGTITTYWQRIFAKTGDSSQRHVMASLLQFSLQHRAKH